jgi:hypothetical protein
MKSLGGLALLAGSNEIIHNLMDPVNTAFANGASRMINSGANTGTMAQRLQIVFTTTGSPGDPTNSGKSNGLGDLEILNDFQPVEMVTASGTMLTIMEYRMPVKPELMVWQYNY